MKSATSHLLSALLLLVVPSALAADKQPMELQLGSVAMDIPAAMVKSMTPLARYLGTRTGYKVTFRASPDLTSAVKDLGSGNTHIAYLTPVAYIEAHERFKVVPLVSPLVQGKSTFRLVVVVRKGSGNWSMADLRGKTFAFGDEKALLQPAVVLEAGIRLEDFASSAYIKHYDNIAKAVLHGDFDAGILKESVAEKFLPEGLRVIHRSEPLPSYVFAVSRELPLTTIAKLKKAMLELKRDTPENIAVLDALDSSYEGFAPASNQDYDAVRKLVRHMEKH